MKQGYTSLNYRIHECRNNWLHHVKRTEMIGCPSKCYFTNRKRPHGNHRKDGLNLVTKTGEIITKSLKGEEDAG